MPSSSQRTPYIRGYLFRLSAWIILFASTKGANTLEEVGGRTVFTAPSIPRGGSTKATKTANDAADDVYVLLAQAMRPLFEDLDPTLSELRKAFQSLAAAQQTFKGIDGVAHEAYQRTHSTQQMDTSVAGRAQRSAARLGAIADGLWACELCEWAARGQEIEDPERFQVLLNMTTTVKNQKKKKKKGNTVALRILVLYEKDYNGGRGMEHGGLQEDTILARQRSKGRILILLSEDPNELELPRLVPLMDTKPLRIRMSSDLSDEVASVQPVLYHTAGEVLSRVESVLRSHGNNQTAIHLVGRSIAGGVAAVASTILQGRLPLPGSKQSNRPSNDAATMEQQTSNTTNNATQIPLQGLGSGCTSATIVGSPPPFSSNVESSFITAILFGDDIVCRMKKTSLDRFQERTRRALKSKGILFKQINRMRDTVSLASSSLVSHAHGSEGEETRLAIPGRAFLIRPRRLGDACSIHEVGSQLKGGREALRAAVFWQLNDILPTKSLWKHHDLESYIRGLDRVQLRVVNSEDEE